MSFKKFEDRRRDALKEHEERLAKIAAEESQEREKRIKPLSDRFLTIFQDVVLKALNDRVDDLDRPKFRKALIRARLEAAVKVEIDALVALEDGDQVDEPEDVLDSKSSLSIENNTPSARKSRTAQQDTAPVAQPSVGQ